jgi:glycosyltransferase involved in cell wall biosynthesis
MGTGVPVVATYVAGIPELVEDGVSGLLVPAGRPDLLAEAVARLAADPKLREALAAAARERVVETYDVRRQAAELREVFAGMPGA